VREVVLRIPDEIRDVLGARRNLAKEIMKRLESKTSEWFASCRAI